MGCTDPFNTLAHPVGRDISKEGSCANDRRHTIIALAGHKLEIDSKIYPKVKILTNYSGSKFGLIAIKIIGSRLSGGELTIGS